MRLLRAAGIVIFVLSTIAYNGYKGFLVNGRDTRGPVIEVNNDKLRVSTKVTEEELLLAATAFDEKDGDVTDSLLIAELSRLSKNNTRTITFAAFDSKGNISEVKGQLSYTDYIPPRFSLSKPLIFEVGDSESILDFMTVQDCIDGDLTDRIKYETRQLGLGSSEGIYPIEFQVTNSAGATVYLPTEVEFYNPNLVKPELIPLIHLNSYVVYRKTGEPFDARSYLEGVTYNNVQYSFREGTDGENVEPVISRYDVEVATDLNIMLPGVYTVGYSMTTEEGKKGHTKLIVIVEE